MSPAGVDSLESRDDDDAAFGKRHADAIGMDFANRRLAVHAIGNQADLPPGKADGLLAELGDSHGRSDMETISPVESSVSISRGSGLSDMELASATRSSVVLPMAETTATTLSPARLRLTMR